MMNIKFFLIVAAFTPIIMSNPSYADDENWFSISNVKSSIDMQGVWIELTVQNNSDFDASSIIALAECKTLSGKPPISQYFFLSNAPFVQHPGSNGPELGWTLPERKDDHFKIAAPYLADLKTCKFTVVSVIPFGVENQ